MVRLRLRWLQLRLDWLGFWVEFNRRRQMRLKLREIRLCRRREIFRVRYREAASRLPEEEAQILLGEDD